MSSSSTAPPARSWPVDRSWRFLVRPKWLAWHLFAAAAFLGMLWLGDWQLRRALGGNELSWAYTFEWPIFAVGGAYFWTRTIRDEHRTVTDSGADGSPGSGADAAVLSAEESAASARAAEEDYLARLKAEVRGHGRWHGFR